MQIDREPGHTGARSVVGALGGLDLGIAAPHGVRVAVALALIAHTSTRPVRKRKLLGNLTEIGLAEWLDTTARSREVTYLASLAFDLMARVFNPLTGILADCIDFKRVAQAPIKLFVTATSVRTGRGRVFRNAELTPDVLLASACLPTMFQAIAIRGRQDDSSVFLIAISRKVLALSPLSMLVGRTLRQIAWGWRNRCDNRGVTMPL